VSVRRPRLLDTTPPELLVYDEATDCPYLPDRTARLPMRLPTRPLSRAEFAARLEAGDRRQGLVLYKPACPDCRACEPIRLDVTRFTLGRRHRRVLARGDRDLRVEIGTPTVDDARVAIYNAHKVGRGLLNGAEDIDRAGYGAFLVDSCTESVELRYRHGDRLVGIAIVDRGADGLSAVYTFFDPSFGRYSPGVYSILKQLELCRHWGLRWLYLGLYVEGCGSMRYKADYLPHQRMRDGVWFDVERDPPPGHERAVPGPQAAAPNQSRKA
jgi:arginine-tRNA-protein transferase